jgi:hypothetical protein
MPFKVASRLETMKHAQEHQLSVHNVSKTFKKVNIQKDAGSDGLPGHVLKACVDQLASVITDIFNLSLTESVIATCFKQTTIVPVPKEAKVTCIMITAQ